MTATDGGGQVTVLGLGGTIAMAPGERGLVPGASLEALLAASGAQGRVRIRALDAIASANLTFRDVAVLAGAIADARTEGAVGVVVVQGTDTLEETAFAVELILPPDGPVVFTGAMRAPSQPGSDAAANLAAAIETARSASLGGGVLVALNDEVHAARHVAKTHTTSTAAFSSGERGPLARVHEGRIRPLAGPQPTLPQRSVPPLDAWPRVALIKIGMDADPDLLGALAELGYAGCVIEAMGAGHVPAGLVGAIERLAVGMPVILASRTGAGRVCERTYGYPGSETDLLSRGVIGAAGLGGLKARVALTVALAADAPDPIGFFRAVAEAV